MQTEGEEGGIQEVKKGAAAMAPKIPMFVLAHSSSTASLALQRGKISTLPSPQAHATDEPDAHA
jgi:hypothetical protein